MNALCASVNLDALIALNSTSSPRNVSRKIQLQTAQLRGGRAQTYLTAAYDEDEMNFWVNLIFSA